MKKFIIVDNTLKEYIGKEEIVNIPDGVVSIGLGAFNPEEKRTLFNSRSINFIYSQVKEITIPDTVKQISKEAFKKCKYLKKINLPNTITKINSGAFSYCSSLESIELPSELKGITDNLFREVISLETIIFPEKLETIGYRSFCFCEKLTEINLPNTLKHIGEEAFINCKNIRELVIPEGVETIGKKAFFNCSNLELVILPSTLKNIGEYAFSSCHKLSELEMNSVILNLSDNVFSGTKVNQNTIQEDKIIEPSREKLIELKEKVENTYLVSKELSTSIVESLNPQKERNDLKDYYRLYLSNLQTIKNYKVEEPKIDVLDLSLYAEAKKEIINISDSGLVIYNDEILLGTTLENKILTISENIKIIEEQAFAFNDNIEVIIFPSSIKEIKNKAFYNCINLQMIIFSDSKPIMGKEVFKNTNLKHVSYNGKTTNINESQLETKMKIK